MGYGPTGSHAKSKTEAFKGTEEVQKVNMLASVPIDTMEVSIDTNCMRCADRHIGCVDRHIVEETYRSTLRCVDRWRGKRICADRHIACVDRHIWLALKALGLPPQAYKYKAWGESLPSLQEHISFSTQSSRVSTSRDLEHLRE